jgi:hypothetical protein
MSKVAPFHSVREFHYHDNSRCTHGSEIPANNRISGTRNRPLCKECAKLDEVELAAANK